MTRARGLRPLLALATLLALPSCRAADNGAYGGEPEQQLERATVAADVGRVTALLSAGADPNKMVLHEDHYQSSWKLALKQLRPGRADLSAIVRAMLGAHADPAIAFGQEPSRTTPEVYRVMVVNPMLEAQGNESTEAVRALLDAGLDRRHGQLALVLAVENGQTDIVHLLVEAGVDVNCHPSANTPLVAAIEARNVPLMTYLEQHGAREKP